MHLDALMKPKRKYERKPKQPADGPNSPGRKRPPRDEDSNGKAFPSVLQYINKVGSTAMHDI